MFLTHEVNLNFIYIFFLCISDIFVDDFKSELKEINSFFEKLNIRNDIFQLLFIPLFLRINEWKNLHIELFRKVLRYFLGYQPLVEEKNFYFQDTLCAYFQSFHYNPLIGITYNPAQRFVTKLHNISPIAAL